MLVLCGLALPDDTESPCGGFMVPCLHTLRNEQRTGHSVARMWEWVKSWMDEWRDAIDAYITSRWVDGWIDDGWMDGWVRRWVDDG